MNTDELKKCADLLGQVAMTFATMPTEQAASVQAGLTCVMAQSYLVELAAHFAAGKEAYEAFEATAKGTLEIPASTATVLKILASKPTK